MPRLLIEFSFNEVPVNYKNSVMYTCTNPTIPLQFLEGKLTSADTWFSKWNINSASAALKKFNFCYHDNAIMFLTALAKPFNTYSTLMKYWVAEELQI